MGLLELGAALGLETVLPSRLVAEVGCLGLRVAHARPRVTESHEAIHVRHAVEAARRAVVRELDDVNALERIAHLGGNLGEVLR